MWRPYQLDEIIMNEGGLYFFKFKTEEGLQNVIENGPWLVDQKPLFVQRWVAGICLEKLEPSRIPLWVKIFNVPLEAWNKEGISRIASRIGTPIIMDKVTTSVFERGYGRASFARVLIKVNAAEGIVDNVEIWYKKLNRTMKLRVEYAWQPPICSHCCVFGHSFKGCNFRVLSDEEKTKRSAARIHESAKVSSDPKGSDGWQSVTNRRPARSVVEPVFPQSQQSNASGSGYRRGGGMNIGRGGFSTRGRGGFNDRGGFNGMQKNEERKYVPVKDNGKEKVSGVQSMKKQEMDKGDKKTQALAEDNEEGKDDKENEWQGIRINIDVACDMGIPIDEEESSKWPQEL
ncbi:zinc knuckle CX2CX4HX4C containing protein [Tanacetum coccineum]|uniref:Zinc knuckle CX2CX4HX4C containing protein n=1 Tax=Tanacetum coccineum TaxID=301880 RepID=A0ABQ5AFS4_9ASTR